MKKCSKCNIEREIDQFCTDNSKKDKLQLQCKVCQKQWRENNKNIIKEKDAQYRLNNKNKIKINNKNYRKNNKDIVKLYQKEYKANNKENLNKYKNEYDKIRLKNDPIFRLRKICSVVIRQTLYENNSSKKGQSIIKYLQYTIQNLKKHIEQQFEPWMTWNNHGIYISSQWDDNDQSTWTWQIDHIIPQSLLPYSSMTDDNFQKCWALSNLRPYSAKQNQIDGCTKVRHNI